jgi:MFS family permease
MQVDGTSAQTDAAPINFSTGRRYYILILLLAVGTMNFLDRTISSVLLEPVRKEFNLSDTTMGFVLGLAFAVTFVIICVPAARLADRWSRKNVLGLSLAIWSVMTMLCAAAANGVHMFFTRVGVGFGEAGGSPPSQAMIGDLFPRQSRATALAIYALASPFGFMLGMAAGGWSLGEYGWRTTFLLAGLPGLLLLPLVFLTLPEVPKGLSDGVASRPADPPFWSTVRTLLSIASFRNMMFATALQAILAIGLNQWVPAFLMRSHQIAPDALMGPAMTQGMGLVIGTLAGGPLADWLNKRDLRLQFWLAAGSALVSAALSACAFLAGSFGNAIVLLGLQSAASALFSGPLIAIAMTLSPVAARSVAAALLLVVLNIISIGIAPQVVGILSDLFRPAFQEESLRYALLCSTLLGIPAAMFHLLASRTYRADVAAAAELSGATARA